MATVSGIRSACKRLPQRRQLLVLLPYRRRGRLGRCWRCCQCCRCRWLQVTAATAFVAADLRVGKEMRRRERQKPNRVKKNQPNKAKRNKVKGNYVQCSLLPGTYLNCSAAALFPRPMTTAALQPQRLATSPAATTNLPTCHTRQCCRLSLSHSQEQSMMHSALPIRNSKVFPLRS